VNPLNCKLGAEEIEGLTALDSLRGVSILVVLVTPSMVDTEPVNENETFERKVYEGMWTIAV
jgi:hypothetical protein